MKLKTSHKFGGIIEKVYTDDVSGIAMETDNLPGLNCTEMFLWFDCVHGMSKIVQVESWDFSLKTVGN